MLDTDGLGACAIFCSWAYLAWIGMLDRRDSLYVEEEGLEGAIRESMESLRSWPERGYGNEILRDVSVDRSRKRGAVTYRPPGGVVSSSVRGGEMTLSSPVGG